MISMWCIGSANWLICSYFLVLTLPMSLTWRAFIPKHDDRMCTQVYIQWTFSWKRRCCAHKSEALTYLDTQKVTTHVVQPKTTGKPKIFSPAVPGEVTVSAAVKASLSWHSENLGEGNTMVLPKTLSVLGIPKFFPMDWRRHRYRGKSQPFVT